MPKGTTVGGLRSNMARCLTVLVALLAQGMSLMSPVCFVRCIAPSGHETVELMGQDCHRCDCLSPELSPPVCAVATCGDHHEDEEQPEHDAPEGWQVLCEHCACQHSPLESAPQVQSKSLASDVLFQTLDFVTVPTTLEFVASIRALEKASLSASGRLRPHEPPQLALLATVVLRV